MCDKDSNDELDMPELHECLLKDKGLFMFSDVKNITQMYFSMDKVSTMTFYDYLFLRRCQVALLECGDNGIIGPVIYIL